MVFGNWLFFSMFSGLVGEKGLSRSFVLKKFSGLGNSEAGEQVEQKVIMQFSGSEVREMSIINFCLLRGPGDEANDRARNPADALTCGATPWQAGHRRSPCIIAYSITVVKRNN
jgi:hypothetical protein